MLLPLCYVCLKRNRVYQQKCDIPRITPLLHIHMSHTVEGWKPYKLAWYVGCHALLLFYVGIPSRWILAPHMAQHWLVSLLKRRKCPSQ